MQIIFIHGLWRTPLSFTSLSGRLKRQGHTPHFFFYHVALERFDHIARRYVKFIRAKTGGRPYAVVAHSLGGIITRVALPHLADCPPRHLIMLTPPNHPVTLGYVFKNVPFYRLVMGDSGQKITCPEFYRHLALPTVPTTVIAATDGFYGPLSPFGDEVNDGAVLLAETRLPGVQASYVVPGLHTWMLHSRPVGELVAQVLATVEPFPPPAGPTRPA
jgi:hypothetical protein